jgi:hypothetical protein
MKGRKSSASPQPTTIGPTTADNQQALTHIDAQRKQLMHLSSEVEDLGVGIDARCAILEKLAYYGEVFEEGFCKDDRAFWRGVHDLMRQNRRDLDAIVKLVTCDSIDVKADE